MEAITQNQRLDTLFNEIEITQNAILCECAALGEDFNAILGEIYNEYHERWRNSERIIDEETFIISKMLKDSRSDYILYLYDQMKHNEYQLTPKIRDDKCPVFNKLYFMFDELRIENTTQIHDERMTTIDGRHGMLNEFSKRMEKLDIQRQEFNINF